MKILQEHAGGTTHYRALRHEADGSITVGPSRPSSDEASAALEEIPKRTATPPKIEHVKRQG